jgi:anthranilate synthase component 2
MILLLDNYDSFTYNLLHYIEELGYEVKVARNDQISVTEIIDMHPQAIVISPGPCDPDKAGITLELIEAVKGEIPIFGVCLGHQSIAQVFGGKVIQADLPMHGKTDKMFHKGETIFKDIPSPFIATRYHSLIVERASLPTDLKITAENEDGIIMGLSHKKYNIHGVQFHPESIASEHGHKILDNFLKGIS